MSTIFQKIKNFFFVIARFMRKHKAISAVAFIVLAAAGYYGYKSINNTTNETRYILDSVTRGMIATSISGSGQVAPKEEKTIKAKASGEITYLNPGVASGATVAKGTLIATIDRAEAESAVQDAEENLLSAQISLDKLIGSDEANPRLKQEAEEDLAKAYEDGYNSVSSAFLDLPSIMTGINIIIYGYTIVTYQQNVDYYAYNAYTYDDRALQYRASAEASYKTAKAAYDKNFDEYKKSSMFSDNATIDSLINETYETAKSIAQCVRDTNNLIQFYKDALTAKSMNTNTIADTHISSLSSYLSKTNSNISSLFSAASNIKNDKEAIEDTDSEIRTAKLAVAQKERTLRETKDALNNYYIYATMGGVISDIDLTQGEDISSGSTAVTIITESKIAEITLSEVDVANVKLGNKVTLTFDAIENLTITGEVIEVDSVGAASSGVVSYGVEIAFDTNESNVKPGMSVSATIITNSKNDVLIIPTTAVKSQGDAYYVQVLSETYDLANKTNSIKGVVSATAPAIKTVEIGLSDDTNTEITNGLDEGDQIIIRTVSSAAASSGGSSVKNSASGNMLNIGSSRPPEGATMIIK